jgi:hypothetical protein
MGLFSSIGEGRTALLGPPMRGVLLAPPFPTQCKERAALTPRLGSIARADCYSSFSLGSEVSGGSSWNSKSEGSLEVVTRCAVTVRIVSRVSLVDGGGTASEVGGTGIGVAPSAESGGDLGTCAGRIRACLARFFTKSWTVLGATEICKCSRKKTAISW